MRANVFGDVFDFLFTRLTKRQSSLVMLSTEDSNNYEELSITGDSNNCEELSTTDINSYEELSTEDSNNYGKNNLLKIAIFNV